MAERETGVADGAADPLFDAIAEVGRIIESMPHYERRDAVDRILDGMTERSRRDFLLGVFVVAHDIRRMT